MSNAQPSLKDYLIDQQGIDWNLVLQSWAWLLPPGECMLWLVNRCADLFLVYPDGSVHKLGIDDGSLQKLADSREMFKERIDDPDVANDWLLIPVVDELVAAGMSLGPKQCYAYKRLPILGGDYGADNFSPLDVSDWLQAAGSIHYQLKDLPDGSEVRIDVRRD